MSGHPVTPIRVYVTTFVTLFAHTLLTVLAAHQEFGALTTPIALTIAVIKATCVVWFFMGVRYNTPLTKVVVVSGLVWLMIMFGVTMSDYATRSWMHVPGR
jgi:cytochrome c oxidase subunit 4